MLTTFKRIFLLTMLGLTGVAALLMAGAIFRAGRQPEVMAWTLKCAAIVGFLLIISFAGFTALDNRRWRLAAMAGILLSAVMLLSVPMYVGWEILSNTRPIFGAAAVTAYRAMHLLLTRLVSTGLVITGVLCLVPFVMIPRMQRVGRIVQWTTVLYLSVASFSTLVQIWELGDFGSPQSMQDMIFALLIPAGVCMMGVFVLHKFFEIHPPDREVHLPHTVGFRCPRCDHQQDMKPGGTRCERCRLKVRIEVEEPKCPNCHFNLRGLTRAMCPECGLGLDEEEVARG